jgi:serine/threonine-protein kinase
MGEVFAAENIRTGRPVAVKLLRSDSKQKTSAVARFRREARAAGSINSDHVTQVLDVDEDQEHGIVLVFELLEGESLIDRLKRTGPIKFDELHSIIEQVWMGLADAHRAGIIHRDLKPSNVFLERRPDGAVRVKILDFGISKLPKEMGGETLTEMGQSLGTFSFMPPEQIGKAKTVDHRADIYACATLIYQALTGQLPYQARNILVMVEMKSKTDPRKLSDALGSPADARLEAFLSKGLARDPDERFQTAVEALTIWRELRPGNDQRRQSQSFPASGRGASGPQSAVPSSETPSLQVTPAIEIVPQPGLPMIVEMTTDSAATLAIHPTQNPLLTNGDMRPAAGMPAPTGSTPIHVPSPIAPPPRVGLGGTLHMVQNIQLPSVVERAPTPPPNGPISAEVRSSAPPPERPQQETNGQGYSLPQGNGPDTWDEPAPQNGGQGNLPPHPAGYYIPAGVASTLPIRAAQHRDGRAIEEPGVPTSSDQTQIYKPRRKNQRSSAVPFVLGALVFALVGFGIVAALLKYLAASR